MNKKEQVYDEQIHPLMAQIVKICLDHGIAMTAHFLYDAEKELLASTQLPDGEKGFDNALMRLRLYVNANHIREVEDKSGHGRRGEKVDEEIYKLS